MQNGYFQLVNAPGGFGVKFFPPKDGGEEISITEVAAYLDRFDIGYDLIQIKKHIAENSVYFLKEEECPSCEETYLLKVSEDNMQATVRFYPSSETGKRITFDEFFKDLRYRNIVSGIQMPVLQKHFQSEGLFCTTILVAAGKEPRHGTDARIEYYFNTDVHIQPTMREDGSVDYFHLNVINHCKAGDMLARIIPEDPGEHGCNILGSRIAPRTVKRAVLKFGHNIQLSEDRLSISSLVDGHVTLVEDKVFVSDVYMVENVDLSTGNIEFAGSVQVNGNVTSNYVVKASGNVIINGVVEGAHIIAGGNIIIARGMNGMGKGVLEAGGNVVAKFIENATVKAGGYVNTEAILHSQVSAETEVTANGRRGFITGGHVQAGNRIEVKNLGASMGATTIVEVGVNPELKEKYIKNQKEITEIVKAVKNAQPVLNNFVEKRAKGVRFTEEQLKYVKSTAEALEKLKAELVQKNEEMKEIQEVMDVQRRAEVVVQGMAYPGATVIIGDVSMVLQSAYQYCKFEKIAGDVKMVSL